MPIVRACDLAGELLKPVALPEVFGESVTTVSRQKGKHRIVLIAISARGLHLLDQIHQRLSIVNLAQDFLSTSETLERSSRLGPVWQELEEVPQLLGVHPDLVRAVRKVDAGCPIDRVPQIGCPFDEVLLEDPAAAVAAKRQARTCGAKPAHRIERQLLDCLNQAAALATLALRQRQPQERKRSG